MNPQSNPVRFFYYYCNMILDMLYVDISIYCFYASTVLNDFMLTRRHIPSRRILNTVFSFIPPWNKTNNLLN